MTYFVYILRCSDDTLYTGWTRDVDRRVAEHNGGKGAARYTRSRRPVRLEYTEACSTKSEALRREVAIKRLTREQKLQLFSDSRSVVQSK